MKPGVPAVAEKLAVVGVLMNIEGGLKNSSALAQALAQVPPMVGDESGVPHCVLACYTPSCVLSPHTIAHEYMHAA